MDVEICGFDGERLLELELVRGVIKDKVELLQEDRQGEVGFLPRKGSALQYHSETATSQLHHTHNTSTFAEPEGLPCIRLYSTSY